MRDGDVGLTGCNPQNVTTPGWPMLALTGRQPAGRHDALDGNVGLTRKTICGTSRCLDGDVDLTGRQPAGRDDGRMRCWTDGRQPAGRCDAWVALLDRKGRYPGTNTDKFAGLKGRRRAA